MTRRHQVHAVEPTLVEKALRHGDARRLHFGDVTYVRFTDDCAAAPRGTVILGHRVLPVYPHTGRIFVLERGIERHATQTFHVEEKVDGYNVRIVRWGDQLLPFTRGGFLCPFTYDRLADLADLGPLFREDPDLVLCGEVAGPGNPYIDSRPYQVTEDVAFFAFDLMRLDQAGFMPLAERDELLDRHRVPAVARFGVFDRDGLPRLKELVLELDRRGSEGIVIKPPAEGSRFKYVTPSINIQDLVQDSHLLSHLPPEHFVHRLIRLSIGLNELGLTGELPSIHQRLGEGILTGYLDSVRSVMAQGEVAKRFTMKLNTLEAVENVVEHLLTASQKIQVREVSRRREGDHWILEVEKVFVKSTSELRSLLAGRLVFD